MWQDRKPGQNNVLIYRFQHIIRVTIILVLSIFCTQCASFFGSGSQYPSDSYIFASKDTEEALNVAREYGSVNDAISSLLRKLRKNPKDIKSRLFLSRLYLIKGNNQKAEKHAHIVEQYQFKNIKAKIILANISYLKGFLEKTMLILDPLVRHPKLSRDERNEALNLMAGVALRKGEDSESISRLKWSIKTNPKHLASHMNLGLIYIKNQEYKLAANHFYTVQKYKPGNFDSKLNLGICFAGIGSYKQADEVYNDLYSRNSDDERVIFNMAVLRFRQKQYSESIELLKEYVDKAPSRYMARNEAKNIINEIQLSRVRSRGLSDDDIQDLTERLEGDEGSSANQAISFDTESELKAGFIFTNVGFMPD